MVWIEPKEKHQIHEFPGSSFLNVSQRQCPSRFPLHFAWRMSGFQEPAGVPWTQAVAKRGQSCHWRSVFTGFVWKLSVGLGSSWEFLSNCVPWEWMEAKYNSLSQGPKWGQCRKSGEAARPSLRPQSPLAPWGCSSPKRQTQYLWCKQAEHPWVLLWIPGVTFHTREVWVFYVHTSGIFKVSDLYNLKLK